MLTVLMFVPFVGLFALLVLNQQPTRRLQEAGVRVGFFVARLPELSKA